MTCARVFEAEALRDGRLVGAEAAAFQRHVLTCTACAYEVRALETLAELACSESSEPDALQARREKTRLLAAFDADLVRPPPPSRRAAVWAGAAAVLLALSLVALFLSPRRSPAPDQATPEIVRLDRATVFSERTVGTQRTVALERGALWIHVDHGAQAAATLRVVLPDGELEDEGTTFTVAAADGATTRVAVEEGRVVLRLRGRAPVVLGAGEEWDAPKPVAPAALSPAPTSEPSAVAATPPRPTATPARPAPAPDPAADFRAAMTAFDRGDHRNAATSFATFLDRYPSDSRAEDAAYLRVIALQRSGDRDATKGAALDYLRRFPDGFRRAEVLGLAAP